MSVGAISDDALREALCDRAIGRFMGRALSDASVAELEADVAEAMTGDPFLALCEGMGTSRELR